ncbi:MAG: 7-cyano-7-deazaguanine synthase QueC [Lachnospiraceae bacterium]
MKTQKESAIVVFSGGQDSTTCLYWALDRFKNVSTVTFDYGQRHSGEIDVAAKIAKDLSVPHYALDVTLLNQLAPSSLTRDDIDVVKAESAQKELKEGELPNTFVPGRNMVFLVFAGILARQIGAGNLVTGVCETDYSGYPDCRADFIKSINETINLAMDESIIIHTPLMYLSKKDTWALADSLGVMDIIKNNTLTCYNGIIGDGCQECPACFLRKQGLDEYLGEKK